jgi:hypothetical protein
MRRLPAGNDPAARMFSQVRELLVRHRQSFPFPFYHMEVLKSLLPSSVVNHSDHPVRDWDWENLYATMYKSQGQINIEIDADPGLSFWLVPEEFFWMPHVGVGAFQMRGSCPFYGGATKWRKEASQLQETLKATEAILHEYLMKSAHPVIVKDNWPELHQFVNIALPLSQKKPLAQRSIRLPKVGEDSKTEIINYLAGATLLPDVECKAWVGYTEM